MSRSDIFAKRFFIVSFLSFLVYAVASIYYYNYYRSECSNIVNSKLNMPGTVKIGTKDDCECSYEELKLQTVDNTNLKDKTPFELVKINHPNCSDESIKRFLKKEM